MPVADLDKKGEVYLLISEMKKFKNEFVQVRLLLDILVLCRFARGSATHLPLTLVRSTAIRAPTASWAASGCASPSSRELLLAL